MEKVLDAMKSWLLQLHGPWVLGQLVTLRRPRNQNRAQLSSDSKMVHTESPSGLHVQSTDQCKILNQSPSGLVLPWRKSHFLTVLEAKSKIEPASSAPVKTLFLVADSHLLTVSSCG